MTITYVGAGAVATGVNASLVPALPAGLQAGDLMLLGVSIRNAGSGGGVNTPTGWAYMTGGTGFEVKGKFYVPGDVAPTVPFIGGVANADTQAVIIAFRGVHPDGGTAGSVTLTNASAQNIAYPAATLPGAGRAVILWAWKQDDSTAVTTPAGFTTAAYSSVTTGDDATLVAQYRIQTVATNIAAGSLTVTGGAAAISRAIVQYIRPAVLISAIEQNVYPPRVLVTVNGLDIGEAVQVYREVAGERTPVRGGSSMGTIDPAYVVVDAELPFGVPVRYIAVVEGSVEYATSPTTYDLVGGKVALSDAISGASAEVVIAGVGDKTYTRDSTRFRVGGRNIVVSGPLGQSEGTYELFVDTTSARNNVMDLLATATEGVVQIRQGGVSDVTGDPYDGIDAYFVVDRVTERRFSPDGSDPRRLITIEYAETDGWATQLLARGYTLQDIANYIGPTGTLLDVANYVGGSGGTLLDVAQTDWS